MKIAILTVGDEVVIGKIVNTNASYIAKVLENNHFVVSGHLAVRDTYEAILDGFEYLFKDASIIITTGGLGPTVDDLTKEATAKYFNEDLILYEEELVKVKGYFDRMNLKMPDNNIKQACFSKNSIIIKNDNGTAPGMILEKHNQIIINLPGPPKELEPMLNDTVIPYLKEKQPASVYEKSYRLMNIGESHAETLIKSLYDKYPGIKIAPYASVGVIDYNISTTDKSSLEEFYKCCGEFEKILENNIIGDWTKGINEIIVDMMREKHLTLAIAESCTGGMLTSMIVDVPGCSDVLLQGVVSYSNESKHERLKVSAGSLKRYGAVSEQVASEMARGIAETAKADIGISTTGIAGPSGGTPDKPVGLVYTSIYYNNKSWVFKNIYNGDRLKIRQRTTMGILFALFQIIKAL